MARRGRTGWKAYLPTIRGGVQIFLALVAIKVVMGFVASTVGAKIPASVSYYFPNV